MRADRSRAALDAFLRREGHAAIPTAHVEHLDGAPVALGRWAARQRRLYRESRIDPALAAHLAGLPGWSWEKRSTGPRRDSARRAEVRRLREAGLSLSAFGHRYAAGLQQ